MKTLYKTFLSILPSVILLILAYILYNKTNQLSKQQLEIIRYAPYVFFTVGAIIAWRFNRSRIFFSILIFSISLFTMNYERKAFLKQEDIYNIICIFLPINIVIFNYFKERGIISFWGILRFVFIFGQILLIYWVLTDNNVEVLKQLRKNFIPQLFQLPIKLTQVGLVTFIVAFILLIIRLVMYQASQDAAFTVILISLFYGLNEHKMVIYSIIFTTISLILIISILQDTYFMAFYDELTGLPSRRALKQDMMKLGMKYTIAMLDIDFFKKFNDTYGHDTGDKVLQLVASIIKDVKGGGKAYRYGGEEFTILFPSKNMDDVISTLEDLREKIAGRGFTIPRKGSSKTKSKGNKKRKTNKTNRGNITRPSKKNITVSIGVAHKDEKSKTPEDVIKLADTALYRAKKKGRNCVSK